MIDVINGDVRGFYAVLGIGLPATAARDASVRCFANPDAHAHADRRPSCSVSLASGAWRCWACDARGGAYDAALARGLSPREAMDLLIAYGLAERRSAPGGRLRAGRRSPSPAAGGQQPRTRRRAGTGDERGGARGRARAAGRAAVAAVASRYLFRDPPKASCAIAAACVSWFRGWRPARGS